MKNKKKMAIASLTLSIISLIPIIILPDSLTGIKITVIIGILVSLIAIILGFVGKSESKGLSISGIIIGFISLIILCFSLIGYIVMGKATDCIDNGDETSTCNYLGQELEIPNSMLTEDQMKKE